MSCLCYRCKVERYALSAPTTGEPSLSSLLRKSPRERMTLCAKCGNKRCPHASDHRFACTESNEPGQPGSRYAAPSPSDDLEGGR